MGLRDDVAKLRTERADSGSPLPWIAALVGLVLVVVLILLL